MLRNVLETDYLEAKSLLSRDMAFYFVLFGIIPSALVLMWEIQYAGFVQEITHKILIWMVSLSVIGVVAFFYYQDYASLFRNNHQLRDEIEPLNFIHAGYTYIRDNSFAFQGEFKEIGKDASLGNPWRADNKMVVMVLIVGETARAANFSLAGYSRETTPLLKKEKDVVYFPDFYSCGTATAVSLPCMFSDLNRKNYNASEAKYSENMVDVIAHAGLPVLWRDNNSGCKGVCDRVSYEKYFSNPVFCSDAECFDEVLLEGLDEKLRNYQQQGAKGVVIVLHQHGSHGPDYFKRTPERFKKFSPYCHTNEIQHCSQEEIVNSYDNTIAYTDFFITKAIHFLKERDQYFDTSLFYVSDHGESLGENNLYLHGLPYAIAPDEQIHVPALFWSSDGFDDRFHLNRECMLARRKQHLSHDNLFHSILGLLDIETSVYDPTLDFFRSCKSVRTVI
jgi:lipid A ethanolaminephosphotransferase